MKKVLKGIGLTLLILVVAVVIGGAVYCAQAIARAPMIDELDAVPKYYRTSVLDDDGNVVLTLAGAESNRVYVSLSEIPVDLQHAFVAIEDERFYTHNGVDIRGVIRAFVRGITGGGFNEGASTITQQLIKNNVLTGWTEETTFKDRLDRKIQEQFLALKLERKVTKDWILENYLNTINLGGGNWGVETAARYYFDKDISELNLSESAVLASITKNPTSYNPRKNPEKNAERRKNVLDKMLSLEYITQEAYDEAMADPVYDRIAAVNVEGPTQEIMTYFEDALVTQLVADLQTEKGMSEESAWDYLYRNGLTVYSTEDSDLQDICEDAASNDDLFDSDAEVSLVMIDNATGQVKALVGGRGEKTASLLFNRATSAVRQPGSSIKILGEYAAAMEANQITLATVFDDAPYTYTDGTEVVNADGEYHGMMTVRNAITFSDNIVALKCFQQIGMDRVYSQIENFGITTMTDADRVEALALGGMSGGVTNLEMTAAYSSIARGGTYIEPVYYTKVVDHNGNIVLEKEPRTREAVSSATAALLTEAMEDVLDRGTGTTADIESMALAGKSGTTTGVRDAWFIGFSPSYTCGVWGGYDDHSAQESSRYVQNVWKSVMYDAFNAQASGSFDYEDGVTCRICTKCGKLAVDGLCDHTVQGDMTRTEVFKPGTEPRLACSCHVEVETCCESGLKANRYCPDTEKTVYLKAASAGTNDEEYVIPDYLNTVCTTHKSFWESWFGGNTQPSQPGIGSSPGSTQPGGGTEPGGSEPGSGGGESSGGSWWNDWFNWGGSNEQEEGPENPGIPEETAPPEGGPQEEGSSGDEKPWWDIFGWWSS